MLGAVPFLQQHSHHAESEGHGCALIPCSSHFGKISCGVPAFGRCSVKAQGNAWKLAESIHGDDFGGTAIATAEV